ncbi:hypothetical protein MVEN_02643400 [Mycena venus]|uniref:RlpA-like protein double-psi beta-barrel domain-containing protein n=1 Tax=Mycena venus TaxID=2733690 RepID=A0A8H6TUT4_9AGAR|nr:hypothetical protein MVEN_02643400 [Mycena venus]
MVFSKVFAPLFAIVLATSANAFPAASPEANASSEIEKRGCTQTYTVISGDICSAIRVEIFKSAKSSASMAVEAVGGETPSLQSPAIITPPVVSGACGSVLQDSDFIVALGTDHWDGGSHCGQTMTSNGASISVTVADLCPGCVGLHGANSIDLSQGAMAALDSNFVNDGITTVQWTLP